MTSTLTRLAARLRIKPMTRERVELMYPPVGACEICRRPSDVFIKATYGGWRGLILNPMIPRRYFCRDPDHVEQVVRRAAKYWNSGEKS